VEKEAVSANAVKGWLRWQSEQGQTLESTPVSHDMFHFVLLFGVAWDSVTRSVVWELPGISQLQMRR